MRVASALLIFTLAVGSVPLCAQSPPEQGTAGTELQGLEDQRARYIHLARDLQDMAKAAPRTSPDRDVAHELVWMTSSAAEYLAAVSDLVFLYGKVTEPVNQGVARAMVRIRLGDYAAKLDLSAKHVNEWLVSIKAPAMAQTALRLKEELRNGSDLLKKIVVK